MPKDDRYRMPVNGVEEKALSMKMTAAHDAVRKLFPPRTGILVIAFDFGEGGGIGYICNAQRADTIKMLEEWIAHQRTLS